jgi:inner membrane protein
MDTITQMTLGAAVGEATLGRKVGNKAVLWGAVAGTIPDLDVLAGPFMDTVSRIAFHRGFTHSISFAILFAPLFGYLLYRLYRGREASWWDWTRLLFLAVVTHPILDNFTSYGTQFFWPFSDYRVAFSTIFVIDPFYTVPFLLTVIALMFYKRTSQKRVVLNYLGIFVSSFYLMFTVVNKLHVQDKFKVSLQNREISFSRIISSPSPFNNILWRGAAKGQDGYWEGYYSLFDKGDDIKFLYIPANTDLLKPLQTYPQIKKLQWITNDFYTISRNNGSLYLNDMRYGRLNGWGKVEGEFVFSFRLVESNIQDSDKLKVYRNRPSIQIDRGMLLLFADRILGKAVF